jgi:hypothetical protein
VKSRSGTVLALVFAVGAGNAAAQQLTAEQAIQHVDKDADGKCSLNEYLTFQVDRIAQFDSNADGSLQYAEFKQSLPESGKKNAERSFDAFDREEAPKALTRREFLGYHAYVFKNYIDADKDGFMSAAEWTKIMAQN